jgi:hypothetical protein
MVVMLDMEGFPFGRMGQDYSIKVKIQAVRETEAPGWKENVRRMSLICGDNQTFCYSFALWKQFFVALCLKVHFGCK